MIMVRGIEEGQLPEKMDRLEAYLKRLNRVAILFSGGVDSTFLAAVAFRVLGENAAALTFNSSLMTQGEIKGAAAEAARIGISHHVIDDPLRQDIAKNPPDRCYLCRKTRDAQAMAWANENGFPYLADGINRTDPDTTRPGIRAADEDGVMHPLREAGITKADIRSLSRSLGLRTWNQESFPCLATRFPFGVSFGKDDLERIEKLEGVLWKLGLEKVRVRVYPPGIAVIETANPERAWFLRAPILEKVMEAGYRGVALDMEGYVEGKMSRFPVVSG